MKKIISVLFILLFSVTFTKCFAEECHDSVDGGPVKTQTLTVFKSGTNITIQPDAAIGYLIYDNRANGALMNITCSTNIVHRIRALAIDSGVKNKDGCPIYKTSVKGIGFVLAYSAMDSSCNTRGPGSEFSEGAPSTTSSAQTLRVRLYVYGQPASGVLEGGNFVVDTLKNDGQTVSYGAFGGPVTINVAGCSMTNDNIPIPLGDIPVDRFTAPGSTVGEQAFTVGFKCSVGINAPTVAMEGIPSADTGDNTVLALSNAGSEGTATGVGAQILSGNPRTPLVINGENTSLKYPVNKDETQQYEFHARYYQTKETVTPGLANATATLNITYQ